MAALSGGTLTSPSASRARECASEEDSGVPDQAAAHRPQLDHHGEAGGTLAFPTRSRVRVGGRGGRSSEAPTGGTRAGQKAAGGPGPCRDQVGSSATARGYSTPRNPADRDRGKSRRAEQGTARDKRGEASRPGGLPADSCPVQPRCAIPGPIPAKRVDGWRIIPRFEIAPPSESMRHRRDARHYAARPAGPRGGGSCARDQDRPGALRRRLARDLHLRSRVRGLAARSREPWDRGERLQPAPARRRRVGDRRHHLGRVRGRDQRRAARQGAGHGRRPRSRAVDLGRRRRFRHVAAQHEGAGSAVDPQQRPLRAARL